jgi:CheY-like chemotaxis protein
MLMTGARSLSGVAVLVVDDDDDLRCELRSIVAFYGADAEDADSVRAARAKLERRHFDVIVSDIEMPGEDGCSFVASVRQSPDARLREIHAAAVSARDDAASRRRALEAGFDVFVSKMASVRTIIRAIEELSRR